ncbi:MAG TPA: TIM barrel protein, partial [Actinomycetota bacterium]|nr:TIM barrel protein [Actinomycetota bacterium]
VGQQFEDLDRFPHLVLDTSHLGVSGIGLSDAYARYRDKIVHFHLSNNAGKGWDSHLSVDEGVLEIGALLEEIARTGYRGTMALELDLRRVMDDAAELEEVLRRNREFCEERLQVRA